MKRAIAILAILFAIPSTLALNVQPDGFNADNQSVMPDSRLSYDYNLDWESSEQGSTAEVSISNTGAYFLGNYPSEVDYDEGSFTLPIISPSSDQVDYPYNKNLNLEFQLVDSNGTEVGDPVQQEINLTTEVPYEVLNSDDVSQDDNWYNTSNQFNLDGVLYNVTDIGDEIAVLNSEDNNTVEVDNQVTERNIRITNEGIVDNEWVKLRFESKVSNDVSFDINTIQVKKQEEPQKCVLGLSTQGGNTLNRGERFLFSTINQNNGNTVGGVSYQLVALDNDGGVIAEGITSENFGTARPEIPQELYQDSPNLDKVQLKLIKQGSNCESNSRTINLNQDYGTFIDNNEEYQLEFTLDNQTFYESVTGTVSTASGQEVGSGIIRYEDQNNNVQEVSFSEGEFSFKPERGGTYEMMATKEGYVKSSAQEFTYVNDKDGDGVPNQVDECRNTEGVEANDGCPQIDVRFEAEDKESGETVSVGELRPNKEYILRLVNENGSVVDYTGEIPIEGSETNVQFTEGVVDNGDTEGIKFTNQRTYRFNLTDARFSDRNPAVTVESAPLVPEDAPVMPIVGGIFILLLLGGGVYVASQSNGSLGGSNDDMDPGAMEGSTTLDPNGGGPD